MTDWQRLEQVIKWTGLSTNAFGAAIGLKRSENLYQVKRGNNRISKDLAAMIVGKYPAVNRSWLLTGDGEIFLLSGEGEPGAVAPGVPFYNMDVVRLATQRVDGRLPGLVPDYYIHVPGFGDCDFAAVCTGDTMAPEVPAGAIVMIKEVPAEAPLLPGEIYLVVTADFAVLRYVRSAKQGCLLLYPGEGSGLKPSDVRRDRIGRLYLVKGIVINKVL